MVLGAEVNVICNHPRTIFGRIIGTDFWGRGAAQGRCHCAIIYQGWRFFFWFVELGGLLIILLIVARSPPPLKPTPGALSVTGEGDLPLLEPVRTHLASTPLLFRDLCHEGWLPPITYSHHSPFPAQNFINLPLRPGFALS